MSSIVRLGILSSKILKCRPPQVSQVRHSGEAFYRRTTWPTARKTLNFRLAQAIMFFAFVWMFSGLYTEEGRMEVMWGHAGYTDPSKWTDEELGIPADEEDV